MTIMPVEELRTAAERLRETAAADEWWTAAGGTVRGLVHPSIAPVLADLLDATMLRYHPDPCPCTPGRCPTKALLAFARAINTPTEETP